MDSAPPEVRRHALFPMAQAFEVMLTAQAFEVTPLSAIEDAMRQLASHYTKHYTLQYTSHTAYTHNTCIDVT